MKKVYEDMCDEDRFQASVFCAGVRCKAICSMTRAALLQYLGSLGRARDRERAQFQVSTQRALTALPLAARRGQVWIPCDCQIRGPEFAEAPGPCP